MQARAPLPARALEDPSPAVSKVLQLRIAGAARLTPGQAAVFTLQRGSELEQGFVLQHQSGLVAYLNRCPHFAVDLDMGDGRFYDEAVDRIYCKTHGAEFRATDGYCDHGPCLGESLEAFPVVPDGPDALVSVENA